MNQNIIDSLHETGVLRTSETIRKYCRTESLYEEITSSIPIPEIDVNARANDIVKGLRSWKAERIIILGPENKLIELLIEEEQYKDIIICFPSDWDDELENDIFSRVPQVPRGKNVSITHICDNKVPLDFSPDNGVILACGFGDDSRALILDTVYSMIDKYKSFSGRRVLASLSNGMTSERPFGWIPINTSTFFNVVM